MITSLKENKSKLEWIGGLPTTRKNIALLIPQFNEGSNTNMEARLEYFATVASTHKDLLDVVIIDDGSTDGSLQRIRTYRDTHNSTFHLAAVTPNAQKVGALHLVALALHHDYIMLSDFDTDIVGLAKIFRLCEKMKVDSQIMGCYFRMLPHEGDGSVFRFQQLEYFLFRSLYTFHKKEGSVPVMPGAGCCYKREILLSIYDEHSGLRNGEDREATLLGLKFGYRAFYAKNILTLTRPPLSFRSLVKQRIRWNLGYIETFYKERAHYFAEIRKFTSTGRRTLLDAVAIKLNILTPYIIIATLIINWKIAVAALLVIYTLWIFLPFHAFLLSPRESEGLKSSWLFSVFYFPIYKISLDCIAWTGALTKFIKALHAEKK
jgi:cellulose synthase/poly-beta-1,6-N-acetylglucosamine synthase-like glycosyltransferase